MRRRCSGGAAEVRCSGDAAEAQRRCSGGAAEERRRWRRPHQTRGRGELAAARELLGRHVLGKVGGAHAAQRERRREAAPRDHAGAEHAPRAEALQQVIRRDLEEAVRAEEDARGEPEGARRQVEVVLHLELCVPQVHTVHDVEHVANPQDRDQTPAQPAEEVRRQLSCGRLEEGERRFGVALVAHDGVELAARRVALFLRPGGCTSGLLVPLKAVRAFLTIRPGPGGSGKRNGRLSCASVQVRGQ